jgi:hypothetical protein
MVLLRDRSIIRTRKGVKDGDKRYIEYIIIFGFEEPSDRIGENPLSFDDCISGVPMWVLIY